MSEILDILGAVDANWVTGARVCGGSVVSSRWSAVSMESTGISWKASSGSAAAMGSAIASWGSSKHGVVSVGATSAAGMS